MHPAPINNAPAAIVLTHNIRVEMPALSSVPQLMEALVQMAVDLDAPSPFSGNIVDTGGDLDPRGDFTSADHASCIHAVWGFGGSV